MGSGLSHVQKQLGRVADRQLVGVVLGLPVVREVLHHGVDRGDQRDGDQGAGDAATSTPIAMATITPSGCTETNRPIRNGCST